MTIKHFVPNTDITDAKAVRMTVFVNEQKFSEKAEFDDIDAVSHHVVIYADKTPIATARLFASEKDEKEYVVGRVAVIKEYRGQGLGAVVMREVEKIAHEIGTESLYLGAQDHACGFYEKLGYKVCGEEYMDEHTPHFPMRKVLL